MAGLLTAFSPPSGHEDPAGPHRLLLWSALRLALQDVTGFHPQTL